MSLDIRSKGRIICKVIQLILRIESIHFYSSQNDSSRSFFYPKLRLSSWKIIQCSADRPPALSIDIRFDIILFLAIPITANEFSDSTGLRGGPRGRDRLKSRIFLVYHDLHSNFLESRKPFQVRTPHFRSILFIH